MHEWMRCLRAFPPPLRYAASRSHAHIAQSIAYRGEGAPSNGKLDFHKVEKGWEQLTFQGKGTDFGREILSGNGSMSRSREARR